MIARSDGRIIGQLCIDYRAVNVDDAGFTVSSLSDYFLDRPAQGLVIGFGTATARDARRLVETLVRTLNNQKSR